MGNESKQHEERLNVLLQNHLYLRFLQTPSMSTSKSIMR